MVVRECVQASEEVSNAWKVLEQATDLELSALQF